MLKDGLYEQMVSYGLQEWLDRERDRIASTDLIDKEEAPRILARYVADIIEQELRQRQTGHLRSQIDFINHILTQVQTDDARLFEDGRRLLALHNRINYGGEFKTTKDPRPLTSMAESSLFTGAEHEPSMYYELQREIQTSDRVDMLVSFIKWSGLRLLMDQLQEFTNNGGQLRIITTSYMGATDVKALETLRQLPNTEIRVSYDTKRTRLHAKAYVFYRDTGFSTAYIGSSNLSNAAISSGLEWDVKITARDLPDTMHKVEATFESYWNASEFSPYRASERTRFEQAIRAEKVSGETNTFYPFDIRPYPYQQEILDKLEAERTVRGHNRNLVVAATGTGKTVISAFDYKRYCALHPDRPNRLLFVAHRREILKQSLATFRGILKDPNFGDLFVGTDRPGQIEHLFLSIQTFNSREFHEHTSPEFYDFIIVDEFHHAAAPSYEKLLQYYQPKILLGLTATPERMDGKDITEYFEGRIAAEIRLPEAIDRQLLSPFQYFGVSDAVDLSELKWVRGGYDCTELSNLYTGNDARVHLIHKQLQKYVTDIDEVKGIGFCVSKEHAKYMARRFNAVGIPSLYLTSDSLDEVRMSAQKRLEQGEIRFIFVVDLYNEGVDIPAINTILFLRPTESLTVFLQQLGRGLRFSRDKDCLTVLDFIGHANKNYRFEEKFAALMESNTRSMTREIQEGFVSLPRGCFIQLERKAKEYVLENIQQSFATTRGFVRRIADFAENTGKEVTLANFLNEYTVDIRDIYRRNNFSRLKVQAGVAEDFSESLEAELTKGFAKVCAINSRRWIDFLLRALPSLKTLQPTEKELRMLEMLHHTLFAEGAENVIESLLRLHENPVLMAELLEILRYNYNRIDFVDKEIEIGFPCPLDLHCDYTRDQILAAMDYASPQSMREGVKYFPQWNLDVLLVTLNKANKDYSPSTMYNDYSINETLFHWQSQNTTSADSPTGQRYMHHKERGSKILLFVREFREDKAGAAPYTFLGLCDFVKSEGEKPMNIVWRLHEPIPAKSMRKTNKLLVG